LNRNLKTSIKGNILNLNTLTLPFQPPPFSFFFPSRSLSLSPSPFPFPVAPPLPPYLPLPLLCALFYHFLSYCCLSTLCFSFWQKTWIKSLLLVLLTCSCASEVPIVCGTLLESLLTCSCANLDKSSDCDSAKGYLLELNRRAWIQSFQQGFFWMWFGQVFSYLIGFGFSSF